MNMVTPFPEQHLPLMWEWIQEFACFMVDDLCPQSFEDMEAKNRIDLANGARVYAFIAEDGIPVGAVWGENAGDSVYAGHLVFDRWALRPPEKLSLARLAIQQIFKDGARKIVWQLFADNRPFHIFMRRLGAQEEGLLKKATRRNGELRDVMLMASFPGDL